MSIEKMQVKEDISFPVVQINSKDIEAGIQYLHDKYDGLIFEEKDVSEAKKDMAELNKIAKSLKDVGKKIKDSVLSSIDPQLKALSSYETQILEIRETVQKQHDTHVEKQKNAKRDEILFMIESLKDEMNAKHIDVPFDTKWLANDKKLSYVKDCATNIINSILLEEQNAKLAQQARADRMAIIENLVIALNEKYQIVFSAQVFQTEQNITMDIEELKAIIENSYIYEKEKQSDQEKQKVSIPVQTKMQEREEVPQEKTVETEPTFTRTITIKYNENHKHLLSQFVSNLRDSGVIVEVSQ